MVRAGILSENGYHHQIELQIELGNDEKIIVFLHSHYQAYGRLEGSQDKWTHTIPQILKVFWISLFASQFCHFTIRIGKTDS